MSTHDTETHNFLLEHLQAILDNDIEAYHRTTSDDLTLYEWWVTPHRVDGIPFHDFMMQANADRGTVFGSEGLPELSPNVQKTRFDLSNLHIQRYGDTAIASYTLLISTRDFGPVHVVAHNETRVMIKLGGRWKVVHVHKSPTWLAPHVQE